MRRIPDEVLKSWPKPNYVNPESRASGIVIVSGVSIALTVIIVALRLYSRIAVSRSAGQDDWLIIPAALSGVAYSAVVILGVSHSGYRHMYDVPLHEISQLRRLIVISNFFALFAVGFTKLSVLALYLRLSPPPKYQRIHRTCMGITIAWMVVTTTTSSLLCRPMVAYWDITYRGPAKCLNEVAVYVAFSAIDVALDTIIYLIPLPVLWQLKLPRRQKIIVGAVFGLGVLVIVAAALRLPSIVRTSKSYDVTWELFDSYLWSQVENTVGIVCASSPALKALIKRYIPVILGSSSPEHSAQLNSHNRTSMPYPSPIRTHSDGWNELPKEEIGVAVTTPEETQRMPRPWKEDIEYRSFYQSGAGSESSISRDS